MRRRTRRGTGGPGRLALIFALTVLLPAIALAALAFRSVEKERRALSAERESDLQRAGLLIRRELIATVEALRREEEARPYYQYEPFFYDTNSLGFGLNYAKSPISEVPPSPLVEGYFQVDPKGDLFSPNFGPGTTQLPSGGQRDSRAPAPPAQQIDVGQVEQQKSRTAEVGDRAEQQQASQAGRTQRALTNVERNLIPQIKEEQRILPEMKKGEFRGMTGENGAQWVSRKAVAANLEARSKTGQILEGQTATIEDQDAQQGEEGIEVVTSAFLLKSAPEGDLLAYRYVDVPDVSQVASRSGRYLRFVQGFTLDTGYITGPLFEDLTERYLGVPGGHAALTRTESEAPPGRLVMEEELPVLPGYRLTVTDLDPEWVSRRVKEQAMLFVIIAGGLLLVITTGLFFSFRAVRAELGLARRKSDFVAAVTHELRTPLTGIKMYADMLKEGWVKDESTRAEYVGFMASETDRLARLVNRVLDFARSEKSGRALEPLDLADPVAEVTRDFGPFVKENGFTLEIDLTDDRPVLACADAVKQILLNLLENAVKYAGEGGDRRLTIRTAPDGESTALSVIDHGPGVQPEERSRVFEDFYRVGEELTRETSGAGIGLALVRRLVESMGGVVGVEETVGGGATFVVRLRVA
jgi:signal transduction histidine kinase